MALSDKMSLNESIAEDASIEWFGAPDYAVGHGPYLAPGEPDAGGVWRGGACVTPARWPLQYPAAPARKGKHLTTLSNRVRSAIR